MTDVLYAARSDVLSDLYTLDTATGAETSIGPIGYAVTALARRDDTTLFGITEKTTGTTDDSTLIVIDKATGAGTEVGPLGLATDFGSFPGIQDAELLDGVLYVTFGGTFGAGQLGADLAVVDQDTGVATFVGTILGDLQLNGGLCFSSTGGFWYAPYPQAFATTYNLYAVDTSAVATTEGLFADYPTDADVYSGFHSFATADGQAVYALVNTDETYSSIFEGPYTCQLVSIDVSDPSAPATTIIGPVLAGMRASTFGAAVEPPPPPATPTRTFDAREWKFIISDLRTTRTLTAITTLMSGTTVERVLGEAWPAATTVPADDPRIRTIFEDDTFDEPFLAEGIRTLIGFRDTGLDPRWEVAYTGLILQVNDAVEDGIPLSHLSAWDLRKYLEYLPVCKDDGTLPGKKGLTFTETKANEIARALLTNLYAGSWGDLLAILLNTTDGVDEDCAELNITFQQGTTIADAWTQLEQSGAIDIILTPFYDPHTAPGIISVLNTYAEAGQERPAAIFGWDRSPRSLTGINRLEDGTKRANVIQYFDANGTAVTPFDDATSIAKYGPYVAQQAFPGQIQAAVLEPLALLQTHLRKNGQTVVEIDPMAQRAAQPVQDYDIGDRTRIEASPSLRKAVSGFARIYRVPFEIGQDTTESVTSLGISADGLA